MTNEQIIEQYKVATHWFQTILSRLDQAIIPLSKLSPEDIVSSWEERYAEILGAYNKYYSVNPPEIELLESLQFIAKVAMGNHRAALRLQGVDTLKAAKMISTPSFPKLERVVFQGYMPG